MLPNLPREHLLDLFRTMLLMRRFEEELILVTKSGVSVGHFHVYIGQECTGAPAVSLLRPDDTIFTTHRNHGHLLARGADPGRLMAEIMGKATGYNKGKGGTLHLTARELGFLSTSALVGGTLPLALGAAFAAKRRGTDAVNLCFFGDGALEEGVFYESINIAALWGLPVIYLCENNSLGALGQKAGEYPGSTIAARDLGDLARVFGVPALSVDGTDAGEVHRAVQEAIARARSGDGPTFVETRTVRWPGTSLLWPDLVTGVMELEYAWNPSSIPPQHAVWHGEQDALLRFTRDLLDGEHATRELLLSIDSEVREVVARACNFAMESSYPSPEAALEDVFA